MGTAKLYNQKQGGIDIDGLIQDYYVYTGNRVSAGDFVEFIKGKASEYVEQSSDTTLTNEARTCLYGLDVVQLDDNRIFIAHGYSNDFYLYGMVCTISGMNITAGTDIQLSTVVHSGYRISAHLLSNGNVFIAHGYNSNDYLYGMICTISGTTITVATDKQLSTTTKSGGALSTILLPNGNIFIAHSYDTDCYLYGMVCTISGTTITAGTDSRLNRTVTNVTTTISTTYLPSGNIFIAHIGGSNYCLYGAVCTTSGTTITLGTNTQLSTIERSGVATTTALLSNGNVFIAHNYGGSGSFHLYGMVCTVSTTTINLGTDTQLSNVERSGNYISTTSLPSGKVFIAHSYDSNSYYLYGMICAVSGTTITSGADTQLVGENRAGYGISSFLLSNGNIFIAHSKSMSYYLCAQIFRIDEANNILTNEFTITEYENQVRKATTSDIYGVAKTSGMGGDSTGHKDMVSIYEVNLNLVSNGDFRNGLTGWTIPYPSTTSAEIVEIDGEKCVKLTCLNGASTGTEIDYTLKSPQLDSSHIMYWSGFIKGEANNAPDESGRTTLGYVYTGGWVSQPAVVNTTTTWTKVSGRRAITTTMTYLRIVSPALNNVMYFKDIKCYDLTAMFGAGNEPTEEWCNANL